MDKSQVWSIEGTPRKLCEFDGIVTLLLPDGKRALCQTKGSQSDSIVDLANGQKTPGNGVYGRGAFRDRDVVIAPLVSHVWDPPAHSKSIRSIFVIARIWDFGNWVTTIASAWRHAIKQNRELIYALPLETRVVAYDLNDRKLAREFKLTGGKPSSGRLDHISWADFCVSQPDGKWLAVSRNFGSTPEIFDGKTGELAATLPDVAALVPGGFVPGKDLYMINIYKNATFGVAGMTAYDIVKKGYVAFFRGHNSDIRH